MMIGFTQGGRMRQAQQVHPADGVVMAGKIAAPDLYVP